MAVITYIEADGRQVSAELKEGVSVMQLAMESGIEGIEAECGGSCACATCHCYVEQGAEQLPQPAEHEDAMLGNVAAERLSNSRLACQLKPQSDLTIRLPDTQT